MRVNLIDPVLKVALAIINTCGFNLFLSLVINQALSELKPFSLVLAKLKVQVEAEKVIF
jgi:hypothetical protein